MKNELTIKGSITTIFALHKGQRMEVLIDTHNLQLVSQYNWYIECKGNTYYAITTTKPKIKMHRLITQAPSGYVVDHINGNGLTNLESNLRVVTSRINTCNRRVANPNHATVYNGVSKTGASGRWVAKTLGVNLGTFSIDWVAGLVALEYRKEQLGKDYIPDVYEDKLYSLKLDNLDVYEESIRESQLRKLRKGYSPGDKPSKSGIPGIYQAKSDGKWIASIRIKGKRKHLGQSIDPVEAGRLVTRATMEHLGSQYVFRTPIKL